MRNIKVIEKAMKIMELLAQGSKEKTLTEIAKALNFNKTTAHRIIRTFCDLGYIVQNKESKKYALSLRLLQIWNSVFQNIEIRQEARPFLEHLCKKTNETVNLMIVEQYSAVYADVILSNHRVKMVSSIGERVDFHSTALGKAFLAYLPKEKVDYILELQGLKRKTRRTITDPVRLRRELENIRKQGYAIDDGEDAEGCRCVAAPIFDHENIPVGGISVAGPAFRLTQWKIKEVIAPLVVSTAAGISTKLGKQVAL